MISNRGSTFEPGGRPAAPGRARVVARLGVFRAGPGGGGGPAATGPGASGAPARTGMACVYLDCPDEVSKEEVAGLVLSAQNGTATFSRSAPGFLVGDTAVKVSLRPAGGSARDSLRLEVSARLAPAHLTELFLFRGLVPRRELEAFQAAFDRTRDYVLTVAAGGRLDLGRVYLVKYYVERGLRPWA